MPVDDPHFIIYAEEFREVLGPDPQYALLAETNAHEGPVYIRDWNALLFTTVPVTTNVPAAGDRSTSITRVDVATGEMTVFRQAANMANGMTLDREGRLLVCEQGTQTTKARIARIDLGSGATETVVDHWFAVPFNSPNDVVVKRDGTVWFTDPSYGAAGIPASGALRRLRIPP